MNIKIVLFAAANLKKDEIFKKNILEIGSFDFNGSIRPVIMSLKPRKYIGVDIVKGSGVDKVCRVEDLLLEFGQERFDMVISTELLEHVRDWRLAIHNIKNICKPKGIIFISTRSYGFPFHGYPDDYWRYEIKDLKHIFGDCDICKIESDNLGGVMVKVKKPVKFIEKDLSKYNLYSIVTDKRVLKICDKDLKSLRFRLFVLKSKIKNAVIGSLRSAGKFMGF
ncbi:MAG: methyltransferase domain-containing protein [Candidatus Firestonebacteria bacterium]